MVSKTQNVLLERNERPEQSVHFIGLDKIVGKLESLAPPAPEITRTDDPGNQRAYFRSIISTAKKNTSLFSREEMGYVLAADFLMQATASEEEIKALGIDTETTPPATVLLKMDPKLQAALKVIAAIAQNSSSYQDALRAGVIALEGCIPYVGGVIAAITSMFWPQNKKSAWDQVKDQVKAMVENAIFENEYNIVQSQITAVQKSLNQYINSPSRTEQANILSASMVLMNGLYERVNQSKSRHMLIGLMVPIGALHLTVLSERYNHYEELFGDDDRTQALKELEASYIEYKDFFDSVLVEWKNWRSNGLKEFFDTKQILWNKEYSYGVRDELGVYNFGYSTNDKARASDFKKWALNKSIADMADVLSGTESYSTFFKDIHVSLSPILTELDTIVLGPYLWTRFQGTGNMRNTIIGGWSNDKPGGLVDRINIYAYNSIDGIQFIYPDMNGTKVTSGGGASFELNLKGKQCIGAKLNYSSGLVYKLQFFFADGSTSPEYGNKGGWTSIAAVDATVGKAYQLALANFAKGSGPSGTTGINGITFTFKRV